MPPWWMTTHSTATHGPHRHSAQAHALATDSPALSFDPSAWMVDVNCNSAGPNDAWTKVPHCHPTLHPIVHSPSVTTVVTSNLFLPLYSLMVEDYDNEDEDPTESHIVLPSCSDESTKPDPPFAIATHCIPKKFKKTQKKSILKSTKATSTSSPSTKPTSTYTLYGMQDCPTCWNNHFCWKHPSPFSNVHFRNTTKIAAQVLFSLLLLSLLLSFFSNYELFMYFCFCFFFHSYGSFNHVNFNIVELL